jgi:hypothetical protein
MLLSKGLFVHPANRAHTTGRHVPLPFAVTDLTGNSAILRNLLRTLIDTDGSYGC